MRGQLRSNKGHFFIIEGEFEPLFQPTWSKAVKSDSESNADISLTKFIQFYLLNKYIFIALVNNAKTKESNRIRKKSTNCEVVTESALL